MSKDPTAHLRAITRGEQRAMAYQDRDNTKAVIAYMQIRGAFKDADVTSACTVQYDLEFDVLSPEQPWKLRRPRYVRMTEERDHYGWDGTKRGRGKERYLGKHRVEIARAEIPYWDYTGHAELDAFHARAREAWAMTRAIQLAEHVHQYGEIAA